MFRDITTLLGDGAGFAATVGHGRAAAAAGAQTIAGIEALGTFISAQLLLRGWGWRFVPIRKPGKLPVPGVLAIDYALEYGADKRWKSTLVPFQGWSGRC